MSLRFKSFLACLLFGGVQAFAQSSDTTVTIKAIAGLQYDLPRFAVRPGTRVILKVENYDDMAHNLVLVRPGARVRVVNAALNMGESGPRQHYVPRMPDVVAHTSSIDPGRSETLVITAPNEQGAYPYVCTYPGHGFLMYGAMYVTRNPQRLPPLAEDTNVAVNRKGDMAGHEGHGTGAEARVPDHPYELTLPAVYRTFMPDCSPAAIAVGLPNNQSYCWDAGTCRLRYAWSGGFVDMSEQWEAKGNKLTHPVGDVYYRDSAGFPFKVGNSETADVQFLGYKLINRYPEFRYTVNGLEVRELIKPAEKGRGLVRRFTLGNSAKPVSFVCKAGDGAKLIPSVGKVQDGLLRLPAGTKSFTITMVAE